VTIPAIYNALTVDYELYGKNTKLTFRGAAALG